MKVNHFLAGAAATVALGLSSAPAFATDLTVGNANGRNCYPFSCAPTDGVTQYQEVYNSTAFPGLISFNQISFTEYTGSSPTGPMDSGTYNVSFYLSANPFPTLSPNLASNEGTLLGDFGTFNLSGPMPATLALRGSTINYDPSQGALLMDVVVSNGSSISGMPGVYNVFFNADYTGASVQRAYNESAFPDSGNTVGALQTTFSSVPEPATWAMLILGVAMIGFAARRPNAGFAVAA